MTPYGHISLLLNRLMLKWIPVGQKYTLLAKWPFLPLAKQLFLFHMSLTLAIQFPLPKHLYFSPNSPIVKTNPTLVPQKVCTHWVTFIFRLTNEYYQLLRWRATIESNYAEALRKWSRCIQHKLETGKQKYNTIQIWIWIFGLYRN